MRRPPHNPHWWRVVACALGVHRYGAWQHYGVTVRGGQRWLIDKRECETCGQDQMKQRLSPWE